MAAVTMTSAPRLLLLWILAAALAFDVATAGAAEKKLQCFACGMPKVHPDNDLPGSYGMTSDKKSYNHSCDDMFDSIVDGEPSNRFLRTCPEGVKSCFGAIGHYDHNDDDATNDLTVVFLGCSEAKYVHDYGCDREDQAVNIRDRAGSRIQVEIDVKLCFCSEHTCNHPDGALYTYHMMGTGVPAARAASTLTLAAAFAAAMLWR